MNKTFALAPLLILSLAGCTLLGGGGGADPEGDESSGGEGSSEELEGGSTACVIDRDWQLDVADMAAQLGEQIASGGVTVISSTAAGSSGIYFDQEGYAGSATDVSYTIVVDVGDGLIMTMVQHHGGQPGGNWAWDGESESTMLFDDWNGEVVITTDTSINGTAAPTSTTPLEGGFGGQSMTVSCDGDTLVTQSEGSPFTSTWHAN
jgi:hypothetical protein